MTGATVINENLGDDLDLIQPEHLGECSKATTTKEETIIHIDEIPKKAQDLIVKIKDEINKEVIPGFIIQHEKRLALLSAKVGIIKVGASSEIELKEKKDRVEDAICATKAAIKEGIVPGGS